MPTFRDKGIVLRTKSLRDADRHYIVFTRDHGKVLLLAKGSRKGKSKMSPHLAGFGVVDVMVAKGKIVDRLAGADLTTAYRDVFGSLEKTALAQGVLLAVDAMTRRDLPDERIFALLTDWFDALNGSIVPVDARSPLFDAAVYRLMDLLGFGFDLHRCVQCRVALVPEGNAISAAHGGIECADCREPVSQPISAEAIKALRFLRGGPLQHVPLLRLEPRHRREVGFVTDLLLATHLEDRFSALRYLRAVG